MFLQRTAEGDPRLVTSATDLTAASACEFAFLRRVDAKLGRAVDVPLDDDPMLARAARLGDAHEERTLDAYRLELGLGEAGSAGGVVEIPRPEGMGEAQLAAVAEQTLSALRGGAELVFQATFFDPDQRPAAPASDEPAIGFVGFADFLRRAGDGSYEVQDTKLARRAKTTALMQLAAYAEQLERIGIPVAAEATLILGDGARSVHRLSDIAPVFRTRRARMHRLLLDRYAAVGAEGSRESADPIAWGAGGVTACGRCEVCAPEVERTRDPLLIAGITTVQRNRLLAAGYDRIEAVAALDVAEPAHSQAFRTVGGAVESERVPGLSPHALERIAAQASVQVAASPGAPPPVRVIDAAALAAIPRPDPGDLFFDFEGDPMYREPGESGDARWGLDYLFGSVDDQERFLPLWAYDLESEKRTLLRFLDLVRQRRLDFPGMRIYHYAAYERTHLLSIAARHGVGEAMVDELLREHVLVDLYPIVRKALRVGTRSYSIKKLEPLYMGDELRDEDGVTNGAQSVTEFAEASAQRRSDDPAERAEGERRLAAIGDYNRYDCVSTLRLRDWLRSIAREHGVEPFPAALPAEEDALELQLSPVAAALSRHAERSTDPVIAKTAALASSAIDYHQREQKSFWWAHYARLVDPVEDWADTRDVLVIDELLSRITEDWHVPEESRARSLRRHLALRGAIAPGSSLRPGGQAYLLYETPAPFATRGAEPGSRGAARVTVVARDGETVVVEELLPRGAAPYAVLPVALVPGPPPHAGQQKGAIEEWGRAFSAALDRDELPRDPVVDLIRRARPVLAAGVPLVAPASDLALAAGGGDEDARVIGAVTSSLRALDRSYLAVQGPPGTGKTYLAARVIRRLVEEDGWRIGVVAQSHRVVEHVLEGIVAAGLPADQVGKVPQSGRPDDAPEPAYRALARNTHRLFLREHEAAGTGCVIGGTAWDFSNQTRVVRHELDLLVIDEAGQFSLAPTIAASAGAKRLLLLGDPQQLPQVSQGTHPEPVDTSALGWLLGTHETMPEELGYFLAETRRMRPELTEVVSELAYEGRLRAHPSTAEVRASGVGEPGLIRHPVDHTANTTHSVEEAEVVTEIVRNALERGRCDTGAGERLLVPEDIIVVAAYNAQVECVAERLAAEGYAEVRVGTVDRFQGQEALLAVVTLAASSAEDVPRGLEFLLLRNRLNVAISRAKWATHLVSSSRLGDGLPLSAEGIAALSGYLRLEERGAGSEAEA